MELLYALTGIDVRSLRATTARQLGAQLRDFCPLQETFPN